MVFAHRAWWPVAPGALADMKLGTWPGENTLTLHRQRSITRANDSRAWALRPRSSPATSCTSKWTTITTCAITLPAPCATASRPLPPDARPNSAPARSGIPIALPTSATSSETAASNELCGNGFSHHRWSGIYRRNPNQCDRSGTREHQHALFRTGPSVADVLSGADLTFPNRLFPEEPIHPMRSGHSAGPTWTAPRISGAGKPRAADPEKSELA